MDEYRSVRQKAEEIRLHIVRMGLAAGGGHLAPALSCADILAVLYFHILRIDPLRPNWAERDRFILSAGHKAAAQYAALALAGFFPLEELQHYLKPNSALPGHPDETLLPGIEMSTGSLGHGLPVATGMALGSKMRKNSCKIFVLLSEGELHEGSTWEAAMSAAHFHLERLVVIVDYNQLSTDGPLATVMDVEPLAEKWRAFGWIPVFVDGHDIPALSTALSATPHTTTHPTVVIARTIKGKGIPEMEGRFEWHTGFPSVEVMEAAEARCEQVIAEIQEVD